MISNSMIRSLSGKPSDCTTKTSFSRTLSLSLTKIFSFANEVTVISPIGIPSRLEIAWANAGLAFPVKMRSSSKRLLMLSPRAQNVPFCSTTSSHETFVAIHGNIQKRGCQMAEGRKCQVSGVVELPQHHGALDSHARRQLSGRQRVALLIADDQ